MSKKRIGKTVAALLGGALLVIVVGKWTRPSATGGTEAEVTPEVAVQVGKITRATLRGYVEGFGMVEPEPATPGKPAASASVASPLAGVVAEVACAEGQRVDKGQLLFRLDDRVAKVAAEKARQAVRFAEAVVEREKTLWQQQNTSLKRVQEAEAQLAQAQAGLAGAETQLALLKIEAPLSATMTRVNARTGDAVDLNKTLAELVDLERLVLTMSVPAGRSPALKLGQVVELRSGQTNPPSLGPLVFISPQVDVTNDTVLVRASIPRNAGLRPGQFVRTRIVTEQHDDCLVVPRESVVTDGQGRSVIALVEGDKAHQKAVTLGLQDGDWIEIQGEGLKEGAAIVTVGAYGLPSEAKIRVVNP